MLLALLLPAMIHAANGEFDTPNQAFTWYSKGPGCMHLKLMTTNASPFRTLHEANYFLRDSEGNLTKVFYIYEQNSENSGYVRSLYLNLLGSESLLYLTNDTKWKPLCLISYVSAEQHDAVRTNKENGYAELDWYYPASVSGKTYTLHVEGTMYYGGGHLESYKRDICGITFDGINFETYDAVPGSQDGEQDLVKIVCAGDHVIKWLQATYTNSAGKVTKLDKVSLPDNSYTGFLMLPATDSHSQVIVTAGVISSTWDKSKLGDTTNPTSNEVIITDTMKNVTMMHAPLNLKSEIIENGNVLLSWNISDVKYPDIIDTDQFLIQRSLTGNADDFSDLGSLLLDINEANYSYKDSSLISTLTSDYINAATGTPKVRYRVLRASTAQLWGFAKNSTIKEVTPAFKRLVLQQPVTATADWSKRDEMKALVKWQYRQADDTHDYVWDERAKMTL